MRDPKRIKKFCDRLAVAWQCNPDWRFGQFMMNVLGEMAHAGRDPFFPEDDEMIKFIERYVGEVAPGELAHNHPVEVQHGTESP